MCSVICFTVGLEPGSHSARETKDTLSAQRSCIFPTRFLIHFVNCLSPPLSLCYVSCELHWKSVCDRHLQYLVSCQTSMRWKTSNMALGSQTHTHTHRERNSHHWLLLMSKHGKNNRIHQTRPKTPREGVLLYKSEILQTKKAYFMVFTESQTQCVRLERGTMGHLL